MVNRNALFALLALALVGSIAFGLMVFGDDASPTSLDALSTPIEYDIERDADVPDLPFDDNPDPSQCGIPIQWGDADATAWLSGIWQGELIQEDVLVYDSHLRQSVTGSAPHGTEVEIVLYQENPVLDYYYVKLPGAIAQAGWVPDVFLSFEPIT